METPVTAASKLECDLVMKGGITSGVIYPRLVSTLAEVYDFRSIGGTSAGAIAAGATAAAQLGVLCGRAPDAFAELGALPDLLGGPARGAGGSMLFNLFQPRPEFRRHFALLTSALNARSKALMGLRIAWAAVWRFPIGALLGAVPGVLIVWTSAGIGRAIGVLFALLGLVVGAMVAAVRSAGTHLPANYFGICNGMPNRPGDTDALTTWLHTYLNGLAGKPRDEPLTFGELWAGKLREPGQAAPHDGTGRRRIELAMITTALNVGRPFRFPFESNDFYFVKEEFDALMPPEVVAWMVAKSRPSATAAALTRPGRTLLALPPAADMPVLLGVRMSLSFPILLSAMPLYSIDRTRTLNAEKAAVPTRVLFSDGGICSNFPVHFFDAPLPSRPTFGVNLREFHPDYPETRVWMPEPLCNNRGLKTYIPEMPEKPGLGSIVRFLGFIVGTMQNWRDQVQLGMPGYRDRIVHVSHTKDEGGMNLNMDASVISTLCQRGSDAADLLREAFVPGSDVRVGAWYNHRRIRMRTLLAGIDQKLRGIHKVLGRDDAPSWKDVVTDADADAYQFTSEAHRVLAIAVLTDLGRIGQRLEDSGIDLATGAPRPESEWRATPRV
jgi:Patatin-like phospholipase